MKIDAGTAIGNLDGFRVVAPGGRLGWVEEMWLDDEGQTTAVVVCLPNAQRGLLVHDEIDEIRPEELTIAVRADARVLQLDPPHLDTGAHGALVASWATSGATLALPELEAASPVVRSSGSESSFFKAMFLLYAALFVIACTLTVICFLIPYLVTGRAY
jgi:hypothetical protein